MVMVDSIFHNCLIFIIPNGLLKKRIKLFEEQITKYGGKIVTNISDTSPTHIVIEENYLTNLTTVINVLKSVKLKYEDIKCDIVSTLWLSRCLKEKTLLDTDNFKFKIKRAINDGSKLENELVDSKIRKIEPEKKVISNRDAPCNQNSYVGDQTVNKIVIEKFEKLAEAYRANGDRWRTVAYDKAVASLKSFQKPIYNVNDLKLLPHISAKMLDKISEIIECGSCNKIEEICKNEKTQVLELFNNVWGAGPVTAQMWYQKGYRTLEDLRTKENLTSQLELSLKYYNEILEPIPRHEVEQIVDYVKNAALSIDSSLQVIPCGSFRRGKLMCGDIDVLVIAQKSKYVLQRIINKLRNEAFLVDDLSVGKEESARKYLGLCKLPEENSKVRRLDIFVVNDDMVGCSLLHYTGSALFNRGIRTYASKMNMSLSEYRLVSNGQILPTPTEESVFEHLKLEYKRPEDRATFQVN